MKTRQSFFLHTLALVATLTTPALFAASATWTGTTSGNSATGSNWSPTATPGIVGATGSTDVSLDIATFASNTNTPVYYTSTSPNDWNLGGILFSGTPGPITIQSGTTGTGTRRIYFTAGGSGIVMDTTVTSSMTFARTGITSGASGDVLYTNNATASAAILNMAATFNSLAPSASTLVLGGTNTGPNSMGNNISNTGGAALSLRKEGAGRWDIGGVNTFTGNTTLNAGTLGIASSTGMSSGTLTINGGRVASVTSPRTPTNNIIVGGDFKLGGLSNSITLNGTMDLGAGVRTITLDNSATLGGAISNGGLTLGTGSAGRTLTLTGTSSYSGATAVASGTLAINGSITSAVSVASSGSLGGNGSIGGSVTLQSGGGLAAKISDWNGAAGVGYDDLSVASLNASSVPITLKIDTTGLVNFTETAKSFTILNATGSITNFSSGNVTVTTTGFSGTGTWTLAQSGTSLVLNYAAAADPYLAWATGAPYNLAGSNALPASDPDFDGIANSVEFVIGGNPASVSNTNLLPTSQIVGSNLVFTYRRSDLSAYLNPTVQYSTNLATWTTAVDGVGGVTIGAPVDLGGGIKQITVTIPKGSNTTLFARLNVVVP